MKDEKHVCQRIVGLGKGWVRFCVFGGVAVRVGFGVGG